MKKIVYCSVLLLVVLLISSCGKANSYSSSNPPLYFGDWTVRSSIASTPISTKVDESLIGMKATYTKEKASFGKDEILNPEYIEQDLSKDAFFNDYRSQLSELRIESESVKTISINNWMNAGNFLIIKDDETMIFLWDGNFYELKREK